jgi:hypothetical protein
MEVRSFQERMHESAAMNRRVTRVFVKPAERPQSEAAFLAGLSQGQGRSDSVGAAALVIQVLLIAADGAVVPSPITHEVQIRAAASDPDTSSAGRQILQYELSRRRLLSAPRQAGLVLLDELAPAYLPIAGNDFSFATPPRMDGDPVVRPASAGMRSCGGSPVARARAAIRSRNPRTTAPAGRARRTRTGYSVRMAWIGSTDAARWAGVKLATIVTTASSAQAMTIVVGSNVETP